MYLYLFFYCYLFLIQSRKIRKTSVPFSYCQNIEISNTIQGQQDTEDNLANANFREKQDRREEEERYRDSKRNTRTNGTCTLVRASLQNDSTRVFSQHLHVHRTRRVGVTFSRRTYTSVAVLHCAARSPRLAQRCLYFLCPITRARAALPVLGNYTTAPGFSECQDDNPRSQMIIRHVQRATTIAGFRGNILHSFYGRIYDANLSSSDAR